MALAISTQCPRCGNTHQLSLNSQSLQEMFFTELVSATKNFSGLTWMGHPIWQNVLDLWTIQETLCAVKPELLIECGTNQGGSALFYAHLFDLMGRGRIITSDIQRMHDLSHPRIRFLIGSSVEQSVLGEITAAVAATEGPVLVILDSDHSRSHVAAELESYARFVTPGSFILVQDGVIDTLPIFQGSRPGPLPAIQEFLTRHPEFEVDVERCNRFLITHHPLGWLRRKS